MQKNDSQECRKNEKTKLLLKKDVIVIFPYNFDNNCSNCLYFNQETGLCNQELPHEKVEKPADETCGAWRKQEVNCCITK